MDALATTYADSAPPSTALLTSTEQVNGGDSPTNSKPETLDLSKKKLHRLSEDLYKHNPSIKTLHLEGNALSFLPDNLFLHLPLLVWLDLRNNEITSLPSTIGEHRQLQYLLLEGNPIKALPVELGHLSSLKALNLRHCPLEFPPEDVVHQGLASILAFLRSFRKEDPDCGAPELPPIEKLNLKALRSSLDLSGDWSSSEEMKHFQMLKLKMEEMAENEVLTCHRKPQGTRVPAKGTGWKFITESRNVERRKSAADRQAEEKERLALALEKQRNQELLKDWQKQSKLMQDQKARGKKRSENHRQVPIAPPFATDLDTSQNKNSPSAEKQDPMPRSVQELEKARAARDLRLDQRIKQHIQTMQERKKYPKRSAQEEMEAASKELEVATLLQAEILQRKREQDAALEYRFTAFTGDLSPHVAPRGAQDVITTTLG
ncbi:leucine-rich repeat-containing protein 27 [Engystomops pustulosus]|uniref:leucine-rich repeat-containing protein 27 n=1 Tax=Engystomops pustulosus TaxID=76066 RepID=UPI003AFA0CBF